MHNDKMSLTRRTKYPSPYKFFESKTSWDLGLNLVEYPVYLFKILTVKLKYPTTTSLHYIPMMILGNVTKLSVKAWFIYLIIKLVAYLEI